VLAHCFSLSTRHRDGYAWVVVTLAAFVAMTMVPAATLLSGSTPVSDDD
jgi:hypothetical protein